MQQLAAQEIRDARRQRCRRGLLPGILAAAAGLAACWIIPYRLATDAGMSYFTPLYLSDELAYLLRIAPLAEGATPANPVNGLGDPSVILPMFLERLLQIIVTITGLDVFALYWAWRVLFPVALLGLLFWLARVCLPYRRPWSRGLHLAVAGCALPLLFCIYHLLCDRFTTYDLNNPAYVPVFFFLNRVPANIEYLLSFGMCALYLRFLANNGTKTAAALGLCAVALIFSRPYTATIPWGMTLALGVLYAAWRKQVSRRSLIIATVIGAAGFAAYCLIGRWNGGSQGYQDFVSRTFPAIPYQRHTHWPLYLLVAAGLAGVGLWVRSFRAVFLVSGAAALAAVPFICGLLPVASTVTVNDRFACFHLPLLFAAGMLVLASKMDWRGRAGARKAGQWSACLGALGITAASVVAYFSASFAFCQEGLYYPAFVARDLRYHRAYAWVRENTPPRAFFLVDDGLDWTRVPRDDEGLKRISSAFIMYSGDYFDVLARRRRVYSDWLTNMPVTNAELYEMGHLHWGTFGFPIGKDRYIELFKKYRPEYVFWRKSPPIFVPDGPVPVPRGQYGRLLRNMSSVVYEDEFSEIWKINYDASAAPK